MPTQVLTRRDIRDVTRNAADRLDDLLEGLACIANKRHAAFHMLSRRRDQGIDLARRIGRPLGQRTDL